jgi:hypothetical protein
MPNAGAIDDFTGIGFRDAGIDERLGADDRPGATLAMTSGYRRAFPRRDTPELCQKHSPKQRAQGMPGARRARSLAWCKKHAS